MNQII